MAFQDKILNVQVTVERLLVEKTTDLQGRFNLQLQIKLSHMPMGIRRDNKGVKIRTDVALYPVGGSAPLFKAIESTFTFTIELTQETNQEEFLSFAKSTNDINRELLPYVDAVLSGITKDMNMTPIVISKMVAEASLVTDQVVS